MSAIVNLKPCRCGGKAAIEPQYWEGFDEEGNICERVSYYCHCTKCSITTGFMSCEEAAADEWEGK